MRQTNKDGTCSSVFSGQLRNIRPRGFDWQARKHRMCRLAVCLPAHLPRHMYLAVMLHGLTVPPLKTHHVL